MEEIEIRVGSEKSPIVLSLTEFRGRKLIGIRKYFRAAGDSNELRPTRKGISLTGQQFSMVLDALKENAEAIESFYDSDFDFKVEQKLIINVGSPLGRLFHFSFENDSTTAVIDERISDSLSEEQRILFINLLLLFYKALLDSLDDEGDIDLVLDSLSHSIGGTIC
jgi:hypothetical protein